jgi:hypothetical protein
LLRSYFRDAPASPGIYALCAGRGKTMYVAYVGMATNIRQRLVKHLVERNSSVVTGASPVSLNPDKVSEVRWWIQKDFNKYLREAELVAFEVLQPILRSRQTMSPPVEFIASQKSFASRMRTVFTGQPSGRIKIPRFHDVLQKLSELEERITHLEHKGPPRSAT